MNGLIAALAQYGFVISVVIVAVVWWRLPRQQKPELLAALVIGSLLCLLLIKVGGALYYDTRPFVTQHVAPLFAHAADNGFPSDHTVLTMFLAICVLYYSLPWGYALVAISLITGATRVLAHIHRPLDVVAAVAMAAVAAVAAHVVARWALSRRVRPRGA